MAPVDRNEPAAVNPLDPGNDANSVESAAADFTRFLAEETPDKEGSRQSRAARATARRSEQSTEGEPDERRADPDDDEAPDTGRSDDSQAKREAAADEADPILDAPAFAPDDEEGDDTGEDEENDTSDKGEDDDAEIDLDREISIKVAGDDVTLPLKEIISGYQRDADYRQKTARLSEEREEVEKFAEEVVAKAQSYDAELAKFIDLAKAFEPSQEDWNKIKAANPEAYIQTKEQWEAVQKNVAEAKAARDKLAAEQAEIQARNYKAYVRTENDKLVEKVPALTNPKKAEQFRKTIFTYARKAGYSEDEIVSGLVNHRDIITAYKAARYDEIVASRKAGQRPAKDVRNSSSSRPRSVTRQRGKGGGNASNLRELDRRAARSGSVEDAAAAFTELVRSG